MTRRTILYAEDDAMVRGTYERFFRRFFPDNPLETFNDGNSLERRLSGNLDGVSLVFTDNQMPGKTGGEIIREYARRKEFEGVPFILFYAGEPIIGKVAVENGAFAYLDKGSSLDELKGVIKQALDLSE